MSPIASVTSKTDPALAPAAAPAPADPLSTLNSKDTFLKLLVAQIKNQNPLNPTDSVQFLGQLTQYSELEQLMNINANIKTLKPAPATDAIATINGRTT